VGKDWIILEGLNAGDKVIVDNIIKLRPGAPVVPNAAGEQPVEPAPDAGQPPAQSSRAESSAQV